MRQMSSSVLRLAGTALLVAEQAVPRYASRRSRHDYTQPQLLALLVLRQRLKLDYRGICSLVAEWAELRTTLRLRQVPHFTTLWYAEQRLLQKRGPAPSSPARSRSLTSAATSLPR